MATANGTSCWRPTFSPAMPTHAKHTTAAVIADPNLCCPNCLSAVAGSALDGAKVVDSNAAPSHEQRCPIANRPIPVSTSLPQLQRLLHAELPAGVALTDLCPCGVARVAAIMAAYDPKLVVAEDGSTTYDWHSYAMYEEGKPYSRNLVDDGNGRFNLMILAWAPDKQSPIHDHAGSHCLMKLLSGSMTEQRYAWPDHDGISATQMTPNNELTLEQGQVAYIHDQIGLHRIVNPSTQKYAASLHLYTPPYVSCHTFNPATAAKRASGACLFFSAAGQKLSHVSAVALSHEIEEQQEKLKAVPEADAEHRKDPATSACIVKERKPPRQQHDRQTQPEEDRVVPIVEASRRVTGSAR